MSDDEGVEPGTPEFEAAAMEGLMSNRALPWADRVACGQKAINILRSLLADHKAASALLADVQAHASDPATQAFTAREFAAEELRALAAGIAVRISALVADRAVAGPRTWELPAEPGPEVTAVRDRNGNIHTRQAGGAYPNGVRHIDGWVNAEFVRPWERLVTKLGPLTDATGEVEDKS